jgi:hypothetical protein
MLCEQACVDLFSLPPAATSLSDPVTLRAASRIKLSYALIVECMSPMAPQDNHLPVLSKTVPPAAGVHVFQPCRLELPVPSRVFPGMRIREENCNMVLLAAVTVFSVAIAGGATLIGFADNKPLRIADWMTGRVEEAPSPDKRIIYVSDQPPVRVVGAPFVPNTNPRER